MSQAYSPAGTDRVRRNVEARQPEPATPTPSPRVAEERARRRRRIDNGAGPAQKLYVPDSVKEPGYAYRWVNDVPGRLLSKTQDDDWDFVYEKSLAEKSAEGADKNSGLGTRIERIVGQTEGGQPLKAYLVKKPLDFHEEDKAREQRLIDERMAGIKRGQAPSASGDNGRHSYVPSGGIRIDEGRS
jgi:hypothetical protein